MVCTEAINYYWTFSFCILCFLMNAPIFMGFFKPIGRCIKVLLEIEKKTIDI